MINVHTLLTKHDVAEICQVSIGKVDSMMENGLPYIKNGRTTRFRRLDLDAYLQKHLVQ